MNGALTCIWGTYDATVSIVEAFDQPTIPEAQRVPPPRLAPIGQPGYYLPDRASSSSAKAAASSGSPA